jgi:hypothetical protein
VPFSLGGNAVIEKASCKECQRITSYLDGYLARHVFGDFRIHRGIQTRNPKERPTELPAIVVYKDKEETHNLPIDSHPFFLALPVWGLPSILLGSQSGHFERLSVQICHFNSPALRAALSISD